MLREALVLLEAAHLSHDLLLEFADCEIGGERLGGMLGGKVIGHVVEPHERPMQLPLLLAQRALARRIQRKEKETTMLRPKGVRVGTQLPADARGGGGGDDVASGAVVVGSGSGSSE